MPKFRKKPIVIEAEQWFPGIEIDGVEEKKSWWVSGKEHESVGAIETLEGVHMVTPGDWIITGISGEKYPCKPDIFEATYEKVDESEYSTCLYQ